MDTNEVSDVNHTAREVHAVLAEMAWEQLPPGSGIEAHLMTMSNILCDPTLYAELWRRVRERACRV